jgi:outer membrane protein assembly factor BamE (lipoprotein component of BamABCDE complex)
MVKLWLAVVVAVGLGGSLAGCGSSHLAKGSSRVRMVDGTIQIGQSVTDTSLRQSVLGIKVGTRAREVRARLGEPFATVAAGHQTCWAYHASQGGSASSMSLDGGSSLDGIDFCMSPSQQVRRILIAVHG